MNWRLLLLFLVACTAPFGNVRTSNRLILSVKSGDVGSPDKRLPITFTQPAPVKIKIEAQRADGSADDGFNGFVRLSVKPGTVLSVSGKNADGRNVRLENGVADDVTVNLVGSYGDTRIWAEDVGYVPADPYKDPPPECSDGQDNDGNGAIDFPNDPNCAFANDDTEAGGTYATGTTPTIYFVLPRVADVRGVTPDPSDPANKFVPGSSTPFPKDQVAMDTGYRQKENKFVFSVVVTRIASDGFYVTDVDDPRGSSSVFAFTFNAPPRLRVCDRLTSFTGTSSDFFGFTEINFPTWGNEEWDPTTKCRVPEPFVFDARNLGDLNTRFDKIAALVRVETADVAEPDDPKTRHHTLRVGAHFGPEHPKGPTYTPTENASNCDVNGDGKIDFYSDPEKPCADACAADVDCVEYSSYAARSDFRLVLHDDTQPGSTGVKNFPDSTIQANASTAAQFDPLAMRGKALRAFTGTLRYFSGGAQFTIEARCAQDIVVDTKENPLPADKACVYPRTESEQNSASN